MSADITNKVIHIIGAVRTSKNEITDKTLVKDLGIDEHDCLELIMRLEDQFRICIDDKQFGTCTSISDVATYIDSILA